MVVYPGDQLTDCSASPEARESHFYYPGTHNEDAKRSNEPSMQVLFSALVDRPIFAFGAPVRGTGGQFDGLVLETLESKLLADRITQASGGQDMLAHLVDAHGRVIAHPDATLVASFAELSGTPPVRAFLSVADARSGTVILRAHDVQRNPPAGASMKGRGTPRLARLLRGGVCAALAAAPRIDDDTMWQRNGCVRRAPGTSSLLQSEK